MKTRTNDTEFNQKAHEIIRQMLNKCEDNLIRNNVCQAHEVEEYLCRHYLAQVASILGGASYFLQSDAAIGAEIFLSRLCGMYSMGRFERYTKICGRQLSFHTVLYFRRYPETLTQMYIETMHGATDEQLRHLNKNGIVQLAAVSLPGVLEEHRRELRRRGIDASNVIAFDGDRARRLGAGKLGGGLLGPL